MGAVEVAVAVVVVVAAVVAEVNEAVTGRDSTITSMLTSVVLESESMC